MPITQKNNTCIKQVILMQHSKPSCTIGDCDHAGTRSIYLLWQLPGIACLKEDNGSLGWSGFGNGCNGFGRGCNGSTRGEAKNGPPRCEANAKAWNCCCCPKRDSTAINRAPVRWTSGTRINRLSHRLRVFFFARKRTSQHRPNILFIRDTNDFYNLNDIILLRCID